MSQQVDSCLPVGQLLRLELLVPALGWPAKPFLVLAQLGLVFPGVCRARLAPGCQPLPEVPLLFLGIRPRLALELEPHLLYPFARQLHDVEAVDDNLGIGEHRHNDASHAVGEVHRHLLDLEPLLLGYHGEYPRHVYHGRALDRGDERAALAVAVLVGEKREQVLVQHRLVYAQPLAHVPLQEHPLPGMRLLAPAAEVTQVFLVGPPEVFAVSPEEAPHALGRHWVGIQPFF